MIIGVNPGVSRGNDPSDFGTGVVEAVHGGCWVSMKYYYIL